MLNKEPKRRMPDALRRRLRDIPRQEVLCRDVDRLYRHVRARAWAGGDADAADTAAERHLAECPRCRQLYATLADAFNLRPVPLPRRLARSLRQVARHPERLLPIWIADTRYAAAACYLLAAVALSLAGDASALFRDTGATVSSKAQVWVDEGEARGLDAWETAAATFDREVDDAWDTAAAIFGREVDDAWDTAARYRVSCQRFFTDVFETLATRELIPGRSPEGGEGNATRPVEGEHDDRSGNDTE